MENATEQEAIRTPIHLWVVGVVAVLWNAIGVVDYVMMRTHNMHYLEAAMPTGDARATLAYMDAMPLLASCGWALGVWGAIAGSLLLLARSRYAVIAYAVSLVGAVVSFAFQFTGPPRPASMSSPVLPIIITVIAMALLLYARWMRSRGVLR